MALRSILVALLLGVVQGVFEWLPISSEGNVALVLALLNENPAVAVQLALFLHLGTAVAATVYYRDLLVGLFEDLGGWNPSAPFDRDSATITFLLAATLVSGVIGLGAYVLLLDLASRLAGGAFIVLIGVLLVLTGLMQRVAGDVALGDRGLPNGIDALLVGIGQGLAILPGISRSGTTLSLLLLRGHDGESAFTLSFVLSIPAAVGAALLTVVDAGGLPGIDPIPALVALGTAALVGYLTIDILMRLVKRIAFWVVCLAIGSLAIVGGVLVLG